jgi:hypothetical protein
VVAAKGTVNRPSDSKELRASVIRIHLLGLAAVGAALTGSAIHAANPPVTHFWNSAAGFDCQYETSTELITCLSLKNISVRGVSFDVRRNVVRRVANAMVSLPCRTCPAKPLPYGHALRWVYEDEETAFECRALRSISLFGKTFPGVSCELRGTLFESGFALTQGGVKTWHGEF